MNQVKYFFDNHKSKVIALSIIIVFVIVFLVGRKGGIDAAQKQFAQVPLPDGGNSLGSGSTSWGNGKGGLTNQGKEFAIATAKKVHDTISGPNVPSNGIDPRIALFSSLFVLYNDQLTAVYNAYNIEYGKGWFGSMETMTEAISSEIMFAGGEVRDKLVNRLKSLKLK